MDHLLQLTAVIRIGQPGLLALAYVVALRCQQDIVTTLCRKRVATTALFLDPLDAQGHVTRQTV